MEQRKSKGGQDKGAAPGPRETPVGAEIFAGRSLRRRPFHSLRLDPCAALPILDKMMRVADVR